MKEVAISEFKSKCLSILNHVNKTKRPVRITRRWKAVAEVVPPSPEAPKHIFGLMKGEVEILGDILSPATYPEDWEVLRD